MRVIRKAGALFVRDGKILLVRKNDTRLFILPGGKLEVGETEEDALARELREELQLICDPSAMKHIATYHHFAAFENDVQLELVLFDAKSTGDPRPASEIVEARWFVPGTYLELMTPMTRDEVLPDLIERRYFDGR